MRPRKTISLLLLFTAYFIFNAMAYPFVTSKEEIKENGPVVATFIIGLAWLFFVWYVGSTPPIF